MKSGIRAQTHTKSQSTSRPSNKEPGLVVIYGTELGRVYRLNTNSTVIGRSSKCDICIDHESASRRQAIMVNTGTSVLIRDLGSCNGTYVNDEPIKVYELRHGDIIKVARTILKFLGPENIELAYHEEIYRRVVANKPIPRAAPSITEDVPTTTMSRPEIGPGDGGSKKG